MRRTPHHDAHPALNPEMAYARKKTAEWLLRLLDDSVAPDGEFFACAGWCIGGLRPLARSLQKSLAKTPPAGKSMALRHGVKEYLESSESPLDDTLEALVREHPRVARPLQEVLRRELTRTAGMKVAGFTLARVKKRTQALFGLSDEAVRLCEYAFLIEAFSAMEDYFEDHLQLQSSLSGHLMMKIFDIPAARYRASIKELTDIGIVEMDSRLFRLQDGLRELWLDERSTKAEKLFCPPLEGETLPLASFSLPADDIACVTSLLEKESRLPLHILLYGAPGTGKTTFARSLAAACKLKAWTVPCRDDDDEENRRPTLRACLHMASRHKGSFVLVDEAEHFLDTESTPKAWLTGLLEEPERRIIWIVNNIGSVEQALRRRFTYSIHFEELGKRERRSVWRQILARHHVQKRISEPELESLCEKYASPAAVIEAAVVRSKEIGAKNADFAAGVERFLRAYNTLRHGGRRERAGRTGAGSDYSLEGVCMEGSVEELLDACREADAELRETRFLPPASGNMLFYGPPGTGKTALARYIAKELDRECVVKRASDLLSKWVGESEKRVADAFARAEHSGAVLVIDEADSFIYSRNGAQHSWESTLVNEFLTALEECRGLCICTTNRRDTMDAAAMRRFSFKVAFAYARPEQVAALYDKLLAPLCKTAMPPDLRRELSALPRLAPGDFHVVRSNCAGRFGKSTTELSHERLVAALRKEQSLKLEGGRIGF